MLQKHFINQLETAPYEPLVNENFTPKTVKLGHEGHKMNLGHVYTNDESEY